MRQITNFTAFILAVAFSTIGALANDSIESLRAILKEKSVSAIEAPPKANPDEIKLGQALFFDPLIGGNRDVSCATCHHPLTATADGRSRAVGTRAYVDKGRRMPEGLRLVDVHGKDPILMGFDLNKAAHPFTPRNSPEIFNRGDSEWKNMFWDSRVQIIEDGKFAVTQMRLTKSPGHYQVVMPPVVKSLLAAQAMMPVTSNDEMRGTKGQDSADGVHNEVGQVPKMDEELIWGTIVKRVVDIEKYRKMLTAAYPEKKMEELHFGDLANAIAAFETDAFTFRDAPWDQFLLGDDKALSESQLRGAELFYGAAKCADCHSGRLLTDQLAHNIGVIPIGPGPDSEEDADYGIAHRSNADLDMKYHFRTPPLRNVELTAPYMHNGAYTTLEAAVRHHLNPVYSLENYDASQLEPEFRGAVHNDKATIRDVKSTMPDDVKLPHPLTDSEFADLMDFLKSFTSPSARDLSHTIPESVPSGLKMVLPFPETD